MLDGRKVVRVLLPPHLQPHAVGKPGYTQRERHIQQIDSGAKCHCVVGWGRDSARMRRYITDRVMIEGKLIIDREGTYWLEEKGWKDI